MRYEVQCIQVLDVCQVQTLMLESSVFGSVDLAFISIRAETVRKTRGRRL